MTSKRITTYFWGQFTIKEFLILFNSITSFMWCKTNHMSVWRGAGEGDGPLLDAPVGHRPPPTASLSRARFCQSIPRVVSLITGDIY